MGGSLASISVAGTTAAVGKVGWSVPVTEAGSFGVLARVPLAWARRLMVTAMSGVSHGAGAADDAVASRLAADWRVSTVGEGFCFPLGSPDRKVKGVVDMAGVFGIVRSGLGYVVVTVYVV